jgi:hypothetical protein
MRFSRGGTYVPHPAGVFPAQFVDYSEDNDSQFAKPGQDRIRLSFDTAEEMDDGRPFRVSRSGACSLNEKSMVYQFLKAVGVDPDALPEEEVVQTLDELIERGAKLQVVIKEYKKQDGTQGTKISDFLPLKTGRRTSAPAPESARELAGAGVGNGGGGKKARPNWEDED